MRFHLRHRVERDADDDQEGGTAEIKGHIQLPDQNRRQERDNTQINGAAQSNPRKHALDVLCGFLTGRMPGI